MSGATNPLLLRLVSALVLVAIALAAAWVGGWLATVIMAAGALIVFHEWTSITEQAEPAVLVYALPVVGALALWTLDLQAWSVALAVAGVVLAAFSAGPGWRSLGVFYAALFGLGPLIIRLSPEHGLIGLIFVFAVVWLTDTGAYFTGRAVGGPKLWPRVSPNKTWSGALGGAAAGVLAGIVVVAAAGYDVSAGLVAVALLLTVVSQCGDLFESSVKRRFGTKDSGTLIPGHGGLMDRVDGLIFTAACAAVVGWLRQPSSPATGLLQW